ncbi:GDP-D-mannose-3',5'-epimerase [Artemisia annua]|uniref:GDP-D-mannose-3',5'-epimerase n=1 Tax=Artemisia annua TaxID=35608 RepID=A0A2U1PIB7_ARTAN|nr:GDP-D-mannose-3',5'-epimerase [Artemisia annua]
MEDGGDGGNGGDGAGGDDFYPKVSMVIKFYPLQNAYGLEKLAAEKLCRPCAKDFGIECKTGRCHNICGLLGTWKGGREKAPSAFYRKGLISLNFREMGFKLDLLTSLMNVLEVLRKGVSLDMDVAIDGSIVTEGEPSVLDAQMEYVVEELKPAVYVKGNGEVQKKMNALRELRRLLSRSEFPSVEIALNVE